MDKINKVYEMAEMICFNGAEEPGVTNEFLSLINSVKEQISELIKENQELKSHGR